MGAHHTGAPTATLSTRWGQAGTGQCSERRFALCSQPENPFSGWAGWSLLRALALGVGGGGCPRGGTLIQRDPVWFGSAWPSLSDVSAPKNAAGRGEITVIITLGDQLEVKQNRQNLPFEFTCPPYQMSN